MILAAAETTSVDQHGNDENHQIDPFHRHPGVHHPCVAKCGEREKKEAEEGDENAVIGVLQIVRQKKEQSKDDARKQDDDQKD
jgi:hypothetical protein